MTDTNHIEVLHGFVEAAARDHNALSHDYVKDEKKCPRCKSLEQARAAITALSARASAGEDVSRLMLAVIGRKHFGNPIPQEWYAAARELLAAAPQPAQAGAGEGGEYVLVPREPTPKMIDSTFNHFIETNGEAYYESHNTRNRRIYTAMIDAAPQPAQAGACGGGEDDENVREAVDREVRGGRIFYFRHNPPNTMLAQTFNSILLANGTYEVDNAKNAAREEAARAQLGVLATLPTTPASPATGEEWRPMETAPRDGTMVRLLVEFTEHATEDSHDPSPTIGANNDDNVGEGEGVGWQFAGWCWTHDHFTQGEGTPVGWLPMVATPQPAAAPQAHPAQGERKCRFCGCKETPERAADPYTTDGTVEVCPQCNEGESYVTECRHLAEYVAGVLTCTRCGFKWTTPPAHGDGEEINPHFWIQAIRTNAHVTDCKEKTQVLLNAADALATYLTTRPTPEAQEARDAARLDWLALHGSFGVDSTTGEPGGNGQRRLAATRTNIDTAMALPAQGEG